MFQANFCKFVLNSTLILLLFGLSGCASNDIYREKFAVSAMTCVAGDIDCEKHSLQEHKTNEDAYSLGFVEIDDQGQLRDRRQMNTFLNYVTDSAKKGSALVVVFVHGWHHNADYDPEDENLHEFKKLLSQLSKAENEKDKKRRIIGLFVGWRGDSIAVPGVRYLTFWDRKSTAQEVGYLGVTELLLRLEKISNVIHLTHPDVKNRLVVIGHSFGGAVVYSATAQILMSRFIDKQKDCSTETGAGFDQVGYSDSITHHDGWGDLVVLLNPAFEALRYAPAFDMAQSSCSEGKAPRLVILTSETDWATGTVFPLGRIFTTFFETHDDSVERKDSKYSVVIDEGQADRNTVGHYMDFISHELMPLGNKQADQVINNMSDLKENIIWGKQHPNEVTQFGQTLLKHRGKTNPTSPFLNIRVDRRIMDGHNAITGPDLKQFLTLLINMTTEVSETDSAENALPSKR